MDDELHPIGIQYTVAKFGDSGLFPLCRDTAISALSFWKKSNNYKAADLLLAVLE
jgi:hypothetical protein